MNLEGSATPGVRHVPLRVTAKTDYGLRAAAELAARWEQGLVKAEAVARAQGIPLRFLLSIMTDLRRGGVVRSHRGADGGFQLTRPPDQISLAEVVTAAEGAVVTIQGAGIDDARYPGSALGLRDVWLRVEAAMESVLRSVSLADLVDAFARQLVPAPAAD